MFKQKRTPDDVERYLSSLLIPPEQLEASYIWAGDPMRFVAVTTHRFVGTQTSQGGDPIIVSIPFGQVAAVKVTDENKQLALAEGEVSFLVVDTVSGDSISINGNVDPAAAHHVYRRLVLKVCGLAEAPVAVG